MNAAPLALNRYQASSCAILAVRTRQSVRPVGNERRMKVLVRTGRLIAIIAGAVFPAIAAFAQEAVRAPKRATPAVAGAAETERVVVTGTYIPVPTAESEGALPVVDYSREQLTTFGANTPAEGLRRVPSFIGNTETENNSKRGTGAAQVNLRALGSRNTLTMINGRRAFSFEDINALPLGFIESVEILKDGASATYGADAVAGVVNFKLRHGQRRRDRPAYGKTNLGVANDAAVRMGIWSAVWRATNTTSRRCSTTTAARFRARHVLSSLTIDAARWNQHGSPVSGAFATTAAMPGDQSTGPDRSGNTPDQIKTIAPTSGGGRI